MPVSCRQTSSSPLLPRRKFLRLAVFQILFLSIMFPPPSVLELSQSRTLLVLHRGFWRHLTSLSFWLWFISLPHGLETLVSADVFWPLGLHAPWIRFGKGNMSSGHRFIISVYCLQATRAGLQVTLRCSTEM